MDMTKFEDVEDPGFVAVTGELRRWVRDIARLGSRQPRLGGEGLQRGARGEENRGTSGRGILTITQGGSHFHGPTTVSGGSLFQGNFVGRDTPF